MSDAKRRRHHTVPRFHLAGFASDRGQLTQIDAATGRRSIVSVNDATVIKDFYAATLPDGTTTDIWERRFAEIEAEVAPVLRRVLNSEQWSVDDDERMILATWIALQFVRGPGYRRGLSWMGSLVTRMQVGMGGIAYLRHVMLEGLGRDVTDDEVEMAWDTLTNPEVPAVTASADEHLDMIQRHVGPVADLLLQRGWCRMRFARHSLAIGDNPVALIGDPSMPRIIGVGISNAAAVMVPLDRRTLLLLPQTPVMGDLQPSAAAARDQNRYTAAGAERFVYTHLDDDPAHLVAAAQRRKREYQEMMSGPDVVNRDRPLEDVLAQIAGHDDPTGGSLIANYTWPIPGYSFT